MAELHIDTDWKKQAQEEKRRLAEQEQQKSASKAPMGAPGAGVGAGAAAGAGGPSAVGASGASPRGAGRPGAVGAMAGAGREMPQASFAALVQSTLTQALFYLGDLVPRGAEPTVNLDMAKHYVDLLGVLEDKTRGNLAPDEQRLLDSALYEGRMRFVSVANQFTGP